MDLKISIKKRRMQKKCIKKFKLESKKGRTQLRFLDPLGWEDKGFG